ncbi:MAG TPA: ATP-binding protein [Rickettsiales bacterium]|nr:ATP-binding protein [Rickettsiales bacterium]
MLLKFSVENFLSIGSKQTIDFTISKKDKLNDSSSEVCGKYVNNVACLLGANGSGKSNLLEAINFYFFLTTIPVKSLGIQYLNDRFQMKLNDQASLKHKLLEHKNTKLDVEFIDSGKLFKLIIEINNNCIISEYLGVHVERDWTEVFSYQRGSDGKLKNDIKFKNNFKMNENDLERFKEMNGTTLYAFFGQYKYLKLILSDYEDNLEYCEFFKNLNYEFIANRLIRDNKFMEFIKTSKTVLIDRINDIADVEITDIKIDKNFVGQEQIFFLHKKNKESFWLEINEESSGTRAIIFLLFTFLSGMLERQCVLFFDEIESGIHPLAIRKILKLFSDKEINKYNSQIFFSTHQPLFLNDRTKTQIFLSKKNDKLETEIYRLDDVEGVRNDENYLNKYLVGCYGAIPKVKWF